MGTKKAENLDYAKLNHEPIYDTTFFKIFLFIKMNNAWSYSMNKNKKVIASRIKKACRGFELKKMTAERYNY